MRCALVDARRNSSRLRRLGDRRSRLNARHNNFRFGSAEPRERRSVTNRFYHGQKRAAYPEGIVELNETAHETLSRCDGRTLGEIVCELAKEYEAHSNALTADVRDTLSDLQRRKLIEFK